MNFDVEKHKIFECISGSRLYGLNKPNSDFDYRGVVIPPMEVLLNPFENFEQKDKGFEEEDRTLYALGKFFKLCADANPNIVELLFVPQSHILFKTPHWNLILQNKVYIHWICIQPVEINSVSQGMVYKPTRSQTNKRRVWSHGA